MSQDRPSVPEILRTVAEFLDGLRGSLEGEAQYHALVSSYVLRIVERELALAPDLDAEERRDLSRLLGEVSSLDAGLRAMCAGIRSGRFDGDWARIADLVLAATVRKVRVVRDEHLAPEHRAAGKSGSGG